MQDGPPRPDAAGEANRGFTMSEMITVEEAQRLILERVAPTEAVAVPVWRAAGLPLAEDVESDIDLSPFAASAMDGYAVRSADIATATPEAPVVLDVVGHEAAGHVFEGAVEAGCAVRIMTGAPCPEGADAVVKYEVTEVLEGDGNEGSRVAFRAPERPGSNVREPGLEARRGSVVMAAGEVCTPAGAGLLASAGRSEVLVHRAPRVGIISLGTELVAPGAVPRRGQIRDANSSALMAEAAAAFAEPVFYGIAPDDGDAICALILRACAECDLVVTSGGASKGDYDYVPELVRREGEMVFDLISMKPGKAITFGMVRGVPFLGLSGNPAAAYMGFEMLARPTLRAMRGFAFAPRPHQRARVTHDVPKKQARRYYDRARLVRDAKTGELTVTEAHSQNSALLGTLHRANCVLMVPDGLEGYAAGDEADVVRIDLPEGTVL